MTALLQFEFDRTRLGSVIGVEVKSICIEALRDTLKNGGTFVLVVSPNKVTAVQSAEAEEVA